MTSIQTISVARPPIDAWPGLAERGAARAPGSQLRARALESAREFTCALPLTGGGLIPGQLSEARALIATGHQPVVYHPGLIFKNRCLQRVCGAAFAGLNLIIDTDRGDAGRIWYPVSKSSIAQLSLCEEENVHLYQRLKPRAELEGIFKHVTSELERLGFGQAAARTREAGALYAGLAGLGIVEANTAVRRKLEGPAAYLDLPLSRLLNLPSAGDLFVRVLSDAAAFFEAYNGTLANFRRARGIRSAANPFPSLRSEEGFVELPFWVIDRAARRPLFVQASAGALRARAGDLSLGPLAAEQLGAALAERKLLLAPRAVMTSLLARSSLCDLFVHGLGGGRYDPFTDALAEAYLGSPLPPFAVASATVRLFAGEVERYEASHIDSAAFRQIYFHLDKHRHLPPLDRIPRERMEALLSDQRAALEEIRSRKAAGRSAHAATHRMKEVVRRLKSAAGRAFSGRTIGKHPDPNYLYTIYFREFPFFFFEQAEIQGVTKDAS